MGRGRAKAKQTKVARQLKYGGPNTDLTALQAELSAARGEHYDSDEAHADESEELEDDPYADDPYAKYYEDDDDEDDDERA